MNKVTYHIIPSGSDMTLCGLTQGITVLGSSLGIGCNCKKCLLKAKKLMQGVVK